MSSVFYKGYAVKDIFANGERLAITKELRKKFGDGPRKKYMLFYETLVSKYMYYILVVRFLDTEQKLGIKKNCGECYCTYDINDFYEKVDISLCYLNVWRDLEVLPEPLFYEMMSYAESILEREWKTIKDENVKLGDWKM